MHPSYATPPGASAHRVVWWLASGLVTLAAAAGSPLPTTLSWVDVVVILAVVTTTGAVFGFAWASAMPQVDHPVLLCAGVAAAAMTWLMGLPPLIGDWTLLVAPLLAATSPPVARWLRRAWATRRVTRFLDSPDGSLDRLRAHLPLVDDVDLRRGWADSEALVARPASCAAVQRLVVVRGLYLDEFERRDPHGFGVWLWASPRPVEPPLVRDDH